MSSCIIPVQPFDYVVFGATGDLTKRKLIPALYHRFKDGQFDEESRIIGVSRTPWSDADFQKVAKESIAEFVEKEYQDKKTIDRFASIFSYVPNDVTDPAKWGDLSKKLRNDPKIVRAFYLAIAPDLFGPTCEYIAKQKYYRRDARVVIEKPLGHDLGSSIQINDEVSKIFKEDQVYRIDHYLGKETVQNLIVFRFANGIFEPVWNNRFVDHVQITGAETVGVEGRGGYFEQAGILRDMVQNHLFQVVSLASMEPPISMDPDAVRDEKLKVLKALRTIPASEMDAHVVRAQYAAGSIAGKKVPGYREEPGVSRNSQTETYVAMKFFIDSWRWAGVPFYLRSGKRMPKRVTEIAIHFKEAPHLLFGKRGEGIKPNVLAIRIQPDEGITLNFGSKLPGPAMEVAPVSMEFRYGSSFGVEPPEAYERLILDCLLGDNTLFTRADEVEASWTWISRIHQHWAEQSAMGNAQLATYAAGSWGPEAAERLLAADHRAWRRP
ncbi:MAG TPA: glucose-6-phosphate dehydrogenase [Polyangia bacterium]|nr:glucose-6-phosphate dehydrogenase [Polyangia bacterium]